MSKFSENLREQSTEMRGVVKQMLDRLTSRSSSLGEQLTQVSASDGVPDGVKATLQAMAGEYGSESQTYVPLMTGIAGAVTANIFDALADQADYLAATGSLKTAVDKLKEHRNLQEAIRIAAAQGDWSAFDAAINDHVEKQA